MAIFNHKVNAWLGYAYMFIAIFFGIYLLILSKG